VERSIPQDVLLFIRRYIDRLETLEVLALLQSMPARAWSTKQVSDELRSSPVAVETALSALVGHRLVAREGDQFSFRPASSELDESTRRLLTCYREKRTGVIAAIFSGPTPAILSFAEAFNIKKDKPDG
jgi:DNA-binding MarR family transcriptional regulator